MSQQLAMFDFPPHVHKLTSFSAACEIQADAATLRQKVFDYLKSRGPATDEEMKQRIPMAPNTQRPRPRELQLKGFIEPSGSYRRTKSGRMAIVWRARNSTEVL